MISLESIQYSLRSLKKKKGRSFLTLFSILIGISTIFIFISFGYGLYNYTEELTSGSSANKLLIMPKGGTFGMGSGVTLDEEDIEAIEKAPGVFQASGFKIQTAEVKEGDKIAVYTNMISYEPKDSFVLEFFDVGVEKGRMLKSEDKAVMLGYNYMIDGKILDRGLDINDNIKIN